MKKIVNNKSYFVSETDTWYPAVLKDRKVIDVLERLLNSDTRVRIWFCDNKGKDLAEMQDVLGYIGKSTGRVKIPLLIYNKRSIGGYAIPVNLIGMIKTTKGELLYKRFDFKLAECHYKKDLEGGYLVYVDNNIHVVTHTKKQAKKVITFLKGEKFTM